MISVLTEAFIHGSESVLEFPWRLWPDIEKRDHAIFRLLSEQEPHERFSWPISDAIEPDAMCLFDFVCEKEKRYSTCGNKVKDLVLHYLIDRADVKRLTQFLDLLENSGYHRSISNGFEHTPFQLEFETPLAVAIDAPKPLRYDATTT